MRTAATALAIAALLAGPASATVFDDAYQCVKANAKLVAVTAQTGPKAIEFVVTQPQCVALVVSPAPLPTGVMVGTLALTAGGVLPQTNPQCEGALYTAAAKPVAAILNKIGILPAGINQQIASGASNEAIGAAVKAIPGASVAFASFSCGCGLSDVGLNPDKVKEVYLAVKAASGACTEIFANLLEGGSEAIVKGVSNVGDAMAGQTQHMEPQQYYQLVFKPRLYADVEKYGQDGQYSGLLKQDLMYKNGLPQCEHYFDKHTMSEASANKTCTGLVEQYFAEYNKALPAVKAKKDLYDTRIGGPLTVTAGGSLLLNTKFGSIGTYCQAVRKKAPAGSSSYFADLALMRCMQDAGAYYGYGVEWNRGKPDDGFRYYNVGKTSDDRYVNRVKAAAKSPQGRTAAQIRTSVAEQLSTEWRAGADARLPQWLSEAKLLEAADASRKGASDAKGAQAAKQQDAQNKMKADQANAQAQQKLMAECKEERCRVEVVAFAASCRGKGSEGMVMQGDANCRQNLPAFYDVSKLRADFDVKLESRVKKVLSVVCPPGMDCTSGVANQRSEIQALANKAWDYFRDEMAKRGNLAGAGKQVLAETTKLLEPALSRQVVAANVPPHLTATPPPAATRPPVSIQPPPPPVTVRPPVTILPPSAAYKSPTPPPIVTSLPPPVAYKAPAPITSFTRTTPPAGSLGNPAAASIVADCIPKSAAEPTQLLCANDAALNRCRSLIASGKVRGCAAKQR